ncbi:MAG: hypothetical protein N2747_02475 [Chitinophagaceae bacterium]|nr:hypothetical protein [Chitinophagaceae bacterium]
MKWIGLAAAILLIVSGFMPWVFVSSANLVISGVNSGGTQIGKPAYFHFLMMFFFILFSLIPKIWAKRVNLVFVSLNMAWAIRNFLILSACHAGECPEKKTGLWLMLLSSVVVFVSALFPDVRIKSASEEQKVS